MDQWHRTLNDIPDSELRREIIRLKDRVDGRMVLLRNPDLYIAFHGGKLQGITDDFVELGKSVIDASKRLVDLGFPVRLNFNRVPAKMQRIMLEHAKRTGLMPQLLGLKDAVRTARVRIKVTKKSGTPKITVKAGSFAKFGFSKRR